ncbi:hypothetical protein AMS68_004603 [Peltaster fructicola]|uniref:Uncharacterized protein n=1 Tax=Peltaster fructicola TaxID=286661 RepID=A0A6H0XWM8_9PEZI|nr:hypothetical protein AMS68_004603 [Peltaster fructicola]
MSSNVGTASTYEAGDQRTKSDQEINAENESKKFNEGKENSHKANDPKDERSIANRLAREEKRGEGEDTLEVQQLKEDPTLPARAHGNEPSKGAKIDKEIQEEEEEILKKKGAFGPK